MKKNLTRNNRTMKDRYILAYTIKHEDKYIDGYEVFDEYTEARKSYGELLEQDNLYTASISKAIKGTDI